MNFLGKIFASVIFYFAIWWIDALIVYNKQTQETDEKKKQIAEALLEPDRKLAAKRINDLLRGL